MEFLWLILCFCCEGIVPQYAGYEIPVKVKSILNLPT